MEGIYLFFYILVDGAITRSVLGNFFVISIFNNALKSFHVKQKNLNDNYILYVTTINSKLTNKYLKEK